MYLLGYDIGSSSIKAALVEAETGDTLSVAQSPEGEMNIDAPREGWAEQHPDMWWEHVCRATKKLMAQSGISPGAIHGIGISYQMHGLVLVDENQQVLRPAIIWCDSRAVEIGTRAFDELGHQKCLSHLLNSPGNFTAAKLKWVKENEPETFGRIHRFMLPGDYIAMRLTGEAMTTPSGLSEGVFWDFKKNGLSDLVLDHFGFDKKIIPSIVPTFSPQGKLTRTAAEATGLKKGTPVTYRAGDQPNNALSLNVLQPGEVAATGGTSGVVYGVTARPIYDPLSRVNGFAHVNHQNHRPHIGILLCINGAGSLYRWVRQNMTADGFSYFAMEKLAATVPVGGDGLRILPFGNGAERMLGNQNPGAHISNLQFNRHTKAHFFRAALEGIAFSFVYGVQILQNMGMDITVLRVGNDNLFQSDIFSETISSLTTCKIEVVKTTGAVGAAKAAGVGAGLYPSIEEAMKKNEVLRTIEPRQNESDYFRAFEDWRKELARRVGHSDFTH